LIDTHEGGVAAYFFGELGGGRILGPAGEKYWGGVKNKHPCFSTYIFRCKMKKNSASNKKHI